MTYQRNETPEPLASGAAPTASAITDEQLSKWIEEARSVLWSTLGQHRYVVERAVLALAPVAGGVPAVKHNATLIYAAMTDAARARTSRENIEDVAAALRLLNAAQPAATVPDGAQRWLAVVQEHAASARKNAQELRAYPGSEQEARARELAAQYLIETAQCMAMDETHADMLQHVADSASRMAALRDRIAAAQPASSSAPAVGGVSRYPDLPGVGFDAGPTPIYTAQDMQDYVDAALATQAPRDFTSTHTTALQPRSGIEVCTACGRGPISAKKHPCDQGDDHATR